MQNLVKEIIKFLDKEVLPKLADLPPVNLNDAYAEYKKQWQAEEAKKNMTKVSHETLIAGAFLFVTGSFLLNYIRKGR